MALEINSFWNDPCAALSEAKGRHKACPYRGLRGEVERAARGQVVVVVGYWESVGVVVRYTKGIPAGAASGHNNCLQPKFPTSQEARRAFFAAFRYYRPSNSDNAAPPWTKAGLAPVLLEARDAGRIVRIFGSVALAAPAAGPSGSILPLDSSK